MDDSERRGCKSKTNIKSFIYLTTVDSRVIDDLNQDLHLEDDKRETPGEKIIKLIHVNMTQTNTGAPDPCFSTVFCLQFNKEY